MILLIFSDFVSSEVDYLLGSGAPFMSPKYYPEHFNLKRESWSEEDRNMSQFMMEAWANFAKEGYIVFTFNVLDSTYH